ncbi:hypothetical protein PpBr36_07497 [Pyricularia pennisetigena]|uniref:hypothetical protein n=1 Tax=Pyricularia pennisetigena TaxID=1578925 RepID=UPI00114E1D26|nr:hypothetical protein PpBr36_07497 [Pyricularia pennisetigena]TLS26018.1 hypothetical protein PpBr36_07497 [Pyricularia pennisetigena]
MATVTLSSPKIAIIGAGPVGCMLARLLHLVDVECTVFEGDDSPNYRSQGGTQDLHTDTGLAATREAGLDKDFEELARYDGEAMEITDEKCSILMQLEASGKDKTRLAGSRPEIDRVLLRQLLGQSLPKGMIRWGHHLKSIAEDGRLILRNGTESGCFNLIVGAEGTWSKVRKVLSNQTPVYSGLSMYELAIPEPETGTLSFTSCKWVLVSSMSMPSSRLTRAGWRSSARIRPRWLKSRRYSKNGTFVDCDGNLKDGLAECEKYIPRRLHMLPVGFRWKHRRGVTIIGDAAHVMTPFAGEGVNFGVEDALDLSTAIIAAVENNSPEVSVADRLDKAVDKYEIEMGPRVDGYTRLTNDLMNTWFFSSAPPKRRSSGLWAGTSALTLHMFCGPSPAWDCKCTMR